MLPGEEKRLSLMRIHKNERDIPMLLHAEQKLADGLSLQIEKPVMIEASPEAFEPSAPWAEPSHEADRNDQLREQFHLRLVLGWESFLRKLRASVSAAGAAGSVA